MDDFEKYQETKYFLSRGQSALEGAFGYSSNSPRFIEYAPADIQKKTLEYLAFLKSYDIEKLRPKVNMLEGELFDQEFLIKEIQNATGYIWIVTELDQEQIEEEGYTVEDMEHNFGVHPNKMKVIGFYRDSRTRGELWLLRLVLMPGCAYVNWDAGRAAGGTEICYSIKELIKEIKRL